jgi:hypothetical protein
VTFDHDRAGDGALVATLTARCLPGRARQVASDRPGVRSFRSVSTAAGRTTTTRFDVFAGGCLTTRLRAPSDRGDPLAADVSRLLGSTDRSTLAQALDLRSGGRLHLDPS